MIQLGVNIDHVATIRQARYRGSLGEAGSEPDPVHAGHEAELGGADIITVHLREDRRHIQDRDLELLRQTVRAKLNLEMGATDEMVGIALKNKVQMVTLVPEGRQEVTTEGGLDVKGQASRMKDVVKRLCDGGITVSAFIDPVKPQVEASKAAGFQMCELHTGAYAERMRSERELELGRLIAAGKRAHELGLKVNAGHGLSLDNIGPILNIPHLDTLNIGHSIVCHALFVGLEQAVREMLGKMRILKE